MTVVMRSSVVVDDSGVVVMLTDVESVVLGFSGSVVEVGFVSGLDV